MGLGLNLNNLAGRFSRPLPNFWEDWQSVSASIWDITNPETGTEWTAYMGQAKAVLNGAENARLRSIYHYGWGNDRGFGDNQNLIRRRMILEFELFLGGSEPEAYKVDGSKTALGWYDSRALAAFTINSGVLGIICGLDEYTIGNSCLIGGDWNHINKFRIDSGERNTYFYVNDHMVKYLQFPDAAGVPHDCRIDFDFWALADQILTAQMGAVRLWFKDVP